MKKLPEVCYKCLYDHHEKKTDDVRYIEAVKEILDNRKDYDSAPYFAFEFKKVYEELCGKSKSLSEEKKKYNDFVLSMEKTIKSKITSSEDPLLTALLYARVGNYIDFSTIDKIDDREFLNLLDKVSASDNDIKTYESFLLRCSSAKSLLYICDNCGEIVLDRFFIEEFHKKFPKTNCIAMVRGAEVQNDVTIEDAIQSGMDKVAEIVDTGFPIAGIIYHRMDPEKRKIIDEADVILAKGQGNFESLAENGIHAFYSFLCKCDYFTQRFNVERLTGMFVEED